MPSIGGGGVVVVLMELELDMDMRWRREIPRTLFSLLLASILLRLDIMTPFDDGGASTGMRHVLVGSIKVQIGKQEA